MFPTHMPRQQPPPLNHTSKAPTDAKACHPLFLSHPITLQQTKSAKNSILHGG